MSIQAAKPTILLNDQEQQSKSTEIGLDAAQTGPPGGRAADGFPSLGKSMGLTVLSGRLLMGALPHLDWGGLSWFALVPFLALFPFRNARAAFAHGVLLGILYLGGMSYWVSVFTIHPPYT